MFRRVFLLVFAIPTLVACETDPTFLGLDPDAAHAMLQRGSFEFLLDVEAEAYGPEEIHRIDEGGAYYLGRAFERLGEPDAAFHFYSVQRRNGAEPWRTEAVFRLASVASTDEQIAAAVDAVGSLLEDSHPGANNIAISDLQVRYLQLLRAANDYERMIHYIEAGGDPDELSAHLALARLGRFDSESADATDVVDEVTRAIRFAPRSEVIVLIDRRFEDDELGNLLPEIDRRALSFRAAVFEMEWGPAGEFLDLVQNSDATVSLLGEPRSILQSRPMIADLREAWFRRREASTGARTFERLAESFNSDIRYYALESAGRLWRAESAHRNAVEVLDSARLSAPTGVELDRVLYHLLHSRVSVDHLEAARLAGEYAHRISEPEQFEDVWERLLSNLVAGRRWEQLGSVYEPLREHGSARTVAQYGVALASAVDAGLLPLRSIAVQLPGEPDGAEAATETGTETVREYLLEPAFEQDVSPYYRIMGAYLLGRPIRGLAGDEPVEHHGGDSLDDRLVAGYLDFGLVDEAYVAVREDGRRPGAGTLRRLAVRLADELELLRSLRIANRLTALDGVVPDRSLARLVYPRAYSQEFEEVLREFPLPHSLYYALVREESYFDATIRSSVGAAGLAQLMPATAADVAGRLRVNEYDLNDPYTNLRFGARYLNDLYRAFEQWVPALVAYNAGQGRVRGWLRSRGDLPMVLFHEAVPFSEPRDYIRKIVVSAVQYEHLYNDGSVKATVELFFPEFGN